MASARPRKSIFTAAEKALIRPFKAQYLEAKNILQRRNIATTSILPCIIGKWRAELAPGEVLDVEQASKVNKHFQFYAGQQTYTQKYYPDRMFSFGSVTTGASATPPVTQKLA